MISNVDGSAETFLADLAHLQSALDRSQRRISSGSKLTVASDAPDEIDPVLRIRSDIGRVTQVKTNLARVQAQVDAGEKALENAVKLVDRATVLASQGAGSTVTASDRLKIAGEVRGLHEQLLGLTRTTVEGRYIFSGDQDLAPAYDLDPAGINGVARLFSPLNTRQIADPHGIAFRVGSTAQEIFDARNPDDTLSAGNVFAAVNGLRVALEQNDQPDVQASLLSLRQAADRLNQQLSIYGAAQNRIAGATEVADASLVRLKTELSEHQDADITEAILELNQARTQQDAALAARGRMPQTSLFDFLGR